MRISIFIGDITDAPAEVICTSTNPRLSLMMGTGGAVRDRGGFEILRACEQVLEREYEIKGRRELPLGSAHSTTAGALPYKAVIHCVASNAQHASSAEAIRVCVRNALERADEIEAESVAMPVFATGHARYELRRAVDAMRQALAAASTGVQHVMIAVLGEEGALELRAAFPEADTVAPRS